MERKVSLINIIGYASVNFLGGGAQLLISLWLMYFYTTMCNLTAVEAGLIFTAARILDGVANPIMGFITDNFLNTRLGRKFGRRRFFILMGVPSIAIIYPALWLVGHSFLFYFVMNLLYEVAYTMVIVPCSTLPAEMTQDAADKSKLTGTKQFCGTIANMIASFIPGQLFLLYGKNNPDAFLMTGISYGLLTAAALFFVWASTFERDPKEVEYHSVGSVWSILPQICRDVGSSMRIKSFRLHAVLMGVGGIFKNLTTGVFVYFAVFVLMVDKVATSNITGIMALVSSIALMFFIGTCYKWGGPVTYKISTIFVWVSVIGYYAISLGGSGNVILLLTVLAVVNTIGRTGIDYVPVFQLAFIADIDEAVTGQRREGLFSGVNSLLSKIATAVEAAMLGFVLQWFGFKAGVNVQPETAKTGIVLLTCCAPFILLGITWIASTYLKLNKERHKILVEEVHRLKSGGSMQEATPEAKKAIKELTGWDYEKCWGHNDVVRSSASKASQAVS